MLPSKSRFLLLTIFLPSFCIAQNFGGNPASIKWRQVNTISSRVIFPKGLDSQANRVSNIIQLLDTTTLYSIGNKRRKWNVVLQNQTTISNAYVRLAPVISELQMTPGQDNFSNGSLRPDEDLVIHEDRHMQQFSNFNNGLTKVFSFLLGQEGQLLANGIAIPDYFFEGDAVFQETLVSKQGRGRLPYFFNGFRSLWTANKNYSWMKLRSGSLRQYTPDHYELGYQLVAYGYEKYGTDFWRKVTADAVNFKGLFYSFNKAVERYSGKTYDQFRLDALNYFKEQTLPASTKEDRFNYITPSEKNNVKDYLFPAFVSNDTVLVTKRSYKELNSFYFLISGREEKLRVKDYVIDDYFSYRNGKVVYAAFQSDPRWDNRDYSVIQLFDIYSKEQKQITFKSKYFSPDINEDGTKIIAVNVRPDGSNALCIINSSTGETIEEIPNPDNYFFTQTKFIDNDNVVSAIRNRQGQMALIKIHLENGETELLTKFSYNVLGYPQVKAGIIYFTMTDSYQSPGDQKPVDRIFAYNITRKELYRITNNINGVYQPTVNGKGEMIFSAFTADGWRLVKANTDISNSTVINSNEITIDSFPAQKSLEGTGTEALYKASRAGNKVSAYKKSFQLFNFHSARPVASYPEYGYTFYSDNILNTLSNSFTYFYNTNERSHNFEFDAAFAQWFPWINFSTEYGVNRNFSTVSGKHIQLNSIKINPGISVPLKIIKGRTFKYINVGAGYNIEKIMYTGDSKQQYKDRTLNYGNAFFSFRNYSRQTKQSINSAWAQTFSINYRDAFSLLNSHKLVAQASLTFPGFFTNHSIVFNGAFQAIDTVSDVFSNIFPYSRGYQDLSEHRMYKFGVNYHFPLFYPDWGIGNIVFFQRVRANAFYDNTHVKALLNNGKFFEFNNRSTGTEIYFDTKIWNALPVSFGVRYSRLLDIDYLNRGAVNRWEFIVPINIIPN